MVQVQLKKVSKVYGKDLLTLKEVNLDILEGEFLVIVGPSGCGKSTLLRIVAGLEEITYGELYIAGNYVNHLSPAERDIGMVFQDYALYPHMTVAENISFGLKIRNLPKNEIEARVLESAQLLGLEGVLNRKPFQLSGGQRQRVAIGRAIVKKPKVFLFDEPLSNLDAQLRAQMRIELATLHKKIGSTTIYVTHDQTEAMTLADRIVVLKAGQIQQVGSPFEIYHVPNNRFIASFMGNPGMNFIEGSIKENGSHRYFLFTDGRIDLSGISVPQLRGSKAVVLGIRPEDIHISSHLNYDFRSKIGLIEQYGHETHLICQIGGQQITIRVSTDNIPKISQLRVGDTLNLIFNQERICWFQTDSAGIRLPTLPLQTRPYREFRL